MYCNGIVHYLMYLCEVDVINANMEGGSDEGRDDAWP